MIGNDAFQEADITGITRPVTKHNYLVRNVDDLPRIIAEAFTSPVRASPARCWWISPRMCSGRPHARRRPRK